MKTYCPGLIALAIVSTVPGIDPPHDLPLTSGIDPSRHPITQQVLFHRPPACLGASQAWNLPAAVALPCLGLLPRDNDTLEALAKQLAKEAALALPRRANACALLAPNGVLWFKKPVF